MNIAIFRGTLSCKRTFRPIMEDLAASSGENTDSKDLFLLYIQI